MKRAAAGAPPIAETSTKYGGETVLVGNTKLRVYKGRLYASTVTGERPYLLLRGDAIYVTTQAAGAKLDKSGC
jgi:hypothetical protein